MRNVRIQLAYDGSLFYGWQRQDGFASVQEAVENALLALTGEPVVVRGAGRTDTGVHALRQVASFHVDTRIGDERLLHALNAHLPAGIVVGALETCRSDFHAQKSAAGKRYAYLIRVAPFRPPFGHELSHWERGPLDVTAMRRGASALVGRRDFKALANAGSPRKSTVRTLRSVHVVERRAGLGIVVEGDGFLYNMVRTIAGTLLDVGRGRLGPEALESILAAGERARAGATAPARGLWLVRVLYDEPCFRGAR
jgi:tRNA pseudouridine38-40 synthase